MIREAIEVYLESLEAHGDPIRGRSTCGDGLRVGRHTPMTGWSPLLQEEARLSGHFVKAGDGARTHDPQLGKLMLYQLSYARVVRAF